MKRTRNYSLLIVALVAAFLLPACATMETTNTKNLLIGAGFQARTPQTAKQKEIYASVNANHVYRATVNGKVFYVFKDEAAGVAYVGHEAEYQKYKQLAIQQRIAQDYYMAMEMDYYHARSWYGWGPHAMWW